MKTQITNREWQQLSDFLDARLSPREQADLEKRLADRADLRVCLEDLKQTRAVLKAAPHRRAPRNFTLRPEMAPARRKLWRGWVPTFSFASIAATFVAGVMLLGQFLPMASQAPMMASAPEAATKELSEPTPMIITWGNPSPVGMGMGGGGGPETSPGLSDGKMPVPTPETPPTLLPADPNQPDSPPDAVAPHTIEDNSGGGLILGLPAEAEQGQVITADPLPRDAEADHQSGGWQPWVTAGAFGLAILFAVLALRFRRR